MYVLIVCQEGVLKEFLHSELAVHPSSTKMYMDLKRQYRWSGMKADMENFVAQCLTCQQVKVKHQRPAG